MKETTIPEKRETATLPTREEAQTIAPPVDIFETPEGLAVIADLPGVEPNMVDVRVDNGVLTISGKAQSSIPGEELYREYELLNYFRQFQLANHFDQEHIKAEMKQGVLTIKLPKTESAKRKKIPVNVTS